MKYIMSGCWTNCVRESLSRLWPSRSVASPEWLAFLQEEATGEAVISGNPGEQTPWLPVLQPHCPTGAEGGPGKRPKDPALLA